MRKKLLLAALVMATMLRAQDVAPDMTGMETDACSWTSSVRMGWNLGNSMESAGGEWDDSSGTWKNVWQANRNEWETAWGNPKTTKAMLQAVKAAGFDAVRLPVRWRAHVLSEQTLQIDPLWMNRVQQIVDWCMELDLKVVLNTHHESWLEYHPVFSRQASINAALATLWKQIATRFRDYDGRLDFAGVNEVQINWKQPTAENNAVMNSYNQTFVDAVRSTGGRNYYRNLVVQTYSCNASYGLSGLELPTDVVSGRIAVEFHYYNPYNYCSGQPGSYYYWGEAFRDKGQIAPETESALQALFRQIRKKWFEQGYGVVVGEYGVSCHYTTNDRTTQEANMQYYMKCVAAEARKNGFAAFAWDNNAFGNGSEKYGIFDRNNNMNVRAPFLLNGIKEGSLAELEPLEDDNTEYVGTVLWEGERELNWGNGLQLNIPASSFADFTTDGKLVVSVRQIPSANYDDLQLCMGNDWKGCPFIVGGSTYNGDYSPRNVNGTTSESYTIACGFSNETLTKLRSYGLYLQGFGLILTKVVLSPSGATGIVPQQQQPTRASSTLYDLSGRRAGKSARIVISNGRKVLRP
ncbi:MAG: glycoside hydrolase family 5 protein [Prevotella sp.]|nr:glycoside hydrolase family 5 protein [Prevotella sp.]